LRFVLAYLSRPFSSGEALLSLLLHQSDLDGLEDQYLFDVAFATKWVQPREMLFARSDGESDLDGLEDQYLLDVAFATKWVQPREMLLLAPTGREWGVGFCFCIRG
jgi:hypothetical protein